MEMKRSSGWRWWPSSQLRPWKRKTPPQTRTARSRTRARPRDMGSRVANLLARGDAQARAGEKAADLLPAAACPPEEALHALLGRDLRAPAELALRARDVAVEEGLVADSRRRAADLDAQSVYLLEHGHQLGQEQPEPRSADDVVRAAGDARSLADRGQVERD